MNRRPSRAVPAVLPVIRIDEQNGTYRLSTDIDGGAAGPEQVPANALGTRVADLVHHAGHSVRLEVVDADGTVHADILDPTSLPTEPGDPSRDGHTAEVKAPAGHNDRHVPQRGPIAGRTLLVVDVSGWEADEPVTVAVILGAARADAEGHLHLEFDPDGSDNLALDHQANPDNVDQRAEVEQDERDQQYGRGRVLLLGSTSGGTTADATPASGVDPG